MVQKNPGRKAASDNWKARKLMSSLTLDDLAPDFFGFPHIRFAGIVSYGRRRCQRLELNLSNRVRGVQKAGRGVLCRGL